MKIVVGLSIILINKVSHSAAGAPSTTLWSKTREMPIIGWTTTCPSTTTGCSTVLPNPRIAASGGLMIGVKKSTDP